MKQMVLGAPEQYDFMPRSWTFPSEYKDFKDAHAAQRAKENEQRQRGETVVPRTYIVKPGSACQGRGIYLAQELEDINRVNGHVVQEYIANPLLINNKKFDLRIYVAVTSTQPLRMYLYQDGLARFCTEDYVAPGESNLKQLFGHLTNYSLNKMNTNFVASEGDEGDDSSKWTLSAWNAFMAHTYGPDAVRGMWRRIQDLMVKTVVASLPVMQKAYGTIFPDDRAGGQCFQLLGFDVMLDDALKPWLIEVNRNPSLRCDALLDQRVKTFLLDQLFYLLDPVAAATPSPALARAALEDAPAPPGCSEESLAAPQTPLQARISLQPAELAVWERRRTALQLQARLEHEDAIVAKLLDSAARTVVERRVSPREEKQVAGAGKLPRLLLERDPVSGFPKFTAAWQHLYPPAPAMDYPLPAAAPPAAALQPYGAQAAAGPDPRALERAGVNLMFPLWSPAEAAASVAEVESLVRLAYERLPAWGTQGLHEALNTSMGLGGPPTAPWTMQVGAQQAASKPRRDAPPA
jgi:hypothetical protein